MCFVLYARFQWPESLFVVYFRIDHSICFLCEKTNSCFSDKTGTLTRNEMKLVKFVIDGSSYDVKYEEKMTTRADGDVVNEILPPAVTTEHRLVLMLRLL